MSNARGWTRVTWLLLIAAFATVIAVACGGDDDDDTGGDVTYGTAGFKNVEIASGQPIKIGYSGPLSGDLKGIGEPIQKAVELAAEDKTIKGHSIQVVSKDDLCSADGGASAATQLIQEGVVAVVGPVCSGAVVAAQPQYEQAGITHVSPSSTAHKPTYPDRGKVFQTFLRTTYSDDIQGPAQAKFAKTTLGAKTAYIVYDTDAYGSGLRDAFKKAFEAEGGKILGSEGYEKKQTDFKAIVTNIKNQNPDIVYFAGFYSEATPFIKQLRAEMKDVKFLAGDGVKNDEFIKGAGADAEGAYLSLPSPVYTGNAYQTFGERFEKETGIKRDASPFVAEAYDAATIILNALEKAASEKDGKLVIDLAKLNEEIRKAEIDGASGKIKFDRRGENIGGETPVSLFVVKNGAFEQLEQ